MRLIIFRVRTLMIAVGAVALLIWGAMKASRAFLYSRLASEYTANERGWRSIAAQRPDRSEFGLQCAEHFAQLVDKYRRARWSPWLTVAPDPHAPGFDQWLEQERRAKATAADPPAPGVG